MKRPFGTIAIDKRIVIEDLNEKVEEFRENNKAVYLSKFYLCETSIAGRLKAVARAAKSVREIDSAKAVEWAQGELSVTLAEKQVEVENWLEKLGEPLRHLG